jgi:two-component system, OmpR family, alkaline phosphatase synthesis response regulator PhoP
MVQNTKKILIVEDDKSFGWILQQGFSNCACFSVFRANDGEEGFNMAETNRPDIILLDIMLPKMDGIAVAKKIKETGIKSQIIFLTNLNDLEHITEAIETVKDTDYIIKSDVHLDQIVTKVKERLGIK